MAEALVVNGIRVKLHFFPFMAIHATVKYFIKVEKYASIQTFQFHLNAQF